MGPWPVQLLRFCYPRRWELYLCSYRTVTALSPQSAEIRRESRPQHLEELLKMNLDTDSIRNIKDIMIRMGISPHDCFERSDLKKKLVENVPELRREIERRASLASQSSSDGVFVGSSRNSSFSGTVATLPSKAHSVSSSKHTNAHQDDGTHTVHIHTTHKPDITHIHHTHTHTHSCTHTHTHTHTLRTHTHAHTPCTHTHTHTHSRTQSRHKIPLFI